MHNTGSLWHILTEDKYFIIESNSIHSTSVQCFHKLYTHHVKLSIKVWMTSDWLNHKINVLQLKPLVLDNSWDAASLNEFITAFDMHSTQQKITVQITDAPQGHSAMIYTPPELLLVELLWPDHRQICYNVGVDKLKVLISPPESHTAFALPPCCSLVCLLLLSSSVLCWDFFTLSQVWYFSSLCFTLLVLNVVNF